MQRLEVSFTLPLLLEKRHYFESLILAEIYLSFNFFLSFLVHFTFQFLLESKSLLNFVVPIGATFSSRYSSTANFLCTRVNIRVFMKQYISFNQILYCVLYYVNETVKNGA
jgi:hypothetical protein